MSPTFKGDRFLKKEEKINKKKELIVIEAQKLYKILKKDHKVKWKNILSQAIDFVNQKFPELRSVEVKFGNSTFRNKVYSLNKQITSNGLKNDNDSKESIVEKIRNEREAQNQNISSSQDEFFLTIAWIKKKLELEQQLALHELEKPTVAKLEQVLEFLKKDEN